VKDVSTSWFDACVKHIGETDRPGPGLIGALCALLITSAPAACADEGKEPAAALGDPRGEPAASSLLHDGSGLRRALALLTDPLAKPIRALRLRVYSDRILLQVRDPSRPDEVQQYRFKAGRVQGPLAVRLAGPGELKDNLFPFEYADVRAIPRLVQQAEHRAGLEEGRAVEVSLQRNLPASMDIRFRVEVEGPRGHRSVEARKDGKVLGVRAEP
jgi:hypothetical protein